MLNENDSIVTKASEFADIFNTFYGSIANYPVGLSDGLNNMSLVDVMNKHCLHDSSVDIKSDMDARVSNFVFHDISVDDILKKIKCLRSGKLLGYGDIHAAFFKLADANCASSLRTLFNKCISYCLFPISMKMADISPIFKKLDNLCKDNYRSVDFLSVLFESIMAGQLTTYFETILSPLVSAYRKG